MPQSLPIYESILRSRPRFCYLFSFPSLLNFLKKKKNVYALSPLHFSFFLQPIPIWFCPITAPKWVSLEYLRVARSNVPFSIVLIVLGLLAALMTADHWLTVLTYSDLGPVTSHSLDFLTTFLATTLCWVLIFVVIFKCWHSSSLITSTPRVTIHLYGKICRICLLALLTTLAF